MAKVGKGEDSTRKVWSQILGIQPDLWVVTRHCESDLGLHELEFPSKHASLQSV